MKPKIYPLLEHCIEIGVTIGYNRAFKHDEKPSSSYITSCIQDAIMLILDEHFTFDDYEQSNS